MMHRVITQIFRLYRTISAALLPPSCRFTPSCSEYAEESIARHGLLRALPMILGRLLDSHRLREQLKTTGAGGEVVPLAFPRPGDNWYREHHGRPRITLFVVLARPRQPGAPLADLFHRDRRDLLGAFTAVLDLAVGPPGDPVDHFTTIGPRRDLEERFAFFLSGL